MTVLPPNPDAIPATSLEAALEAARRGYKVLLTCWPDPDDPEACACPRGHVGKDIGKAPFYGHGYLDATCDPETVHKLWARYPEANAGLWLEGSDLAAVDPDSDHAQAEAHRLGLLPGPIRHSKNAAYLYALPEGCPIERAIHGGEDGHLDVLSEGHLVIYGRHKDGHLVSTDWGRPLRPLMPWAVELLKRRAAEREATAGPVGEPGQPTGLSEDEVIERLKSWDWKDGRAGALWESGAPEMVGACPCEPRHEGRDRGACPFKPYDSESERDLGLMNVIRFWGGPDPARMECLFSRSAPGQRPKWRRASSYRRATIKKALKGKVWSPGGGPDLSEGPATPDTAGSDATPRGIPYRAESFGIVWDKPMKEGKVPVLLSNFTAKIGADVTEDDGSGEVRKTFRIEAKLRDKTYRFEIPAERYAAMNWPTEHLGATAIVSPGQGTKDHARAAIQMLSCDVAEQRVYTHTGLRLVGGRWVYLHAGGALGPNGPVPDIEVRLPEVLARFQLPEPVEGEQLRAAIRASLGMLEVAPRRVTVPLFGGAYRTALGSVDFGEHLSGQTGAGKTELVALTQQHYGPTMDARNLPASWSSTGNSLEGLAFVAKDALLAIDDFCPTGSAADVQRYHRDADRVFRAQGNRAGRQRMRSDASLKPAKPPRGLILSTGEDVPRGQSVRSRVLILELGQGDVDWGRLTQCQQDAAAGLYARSLVGFVRWLTGRYEQLRVDMRDEALRLRELAYRSGQHRRTPGIVADLALGLRYFLAYASDAGAVSRAERDALWAEWWGALGEAARAQLKHQEASEPARRFLQLLGSALARGTAHLAAPNGSEPRTPEAWGWRLFTVGGGENEREEWRPQGDRVGWADGDDVYLEPDAAFAASQRVGQAVGDVLAVTPQTLRKRLHERGLLAGVDEKRETLAIRKIFEGRQHNVLHLRAASLSTPTKPDKPDNGPAGEPEMSGPVSGPVSGSGVDPTAGEAESVRETGPNVGFVGSDTGGEAAGAERRAALSGGPENPTAAPTANPTSNGRMAREVPSDEGDNSPVRALICAGCRIRPAAPGNNYRCQPCVDEAERLAAKEDLSF